MCGRARQVLAWQELKVQWWHGQPALNIEPRWNAAPRQNLTMIRAHGDGDGAEALSMNWGFVPSWEQDPKGGRRPINAKAESIAAGSGMWRDAFRRRRAVFPVSGFYEWQRIGAEKRPYSIDPSDGGAFRGTILQMTEIGGISLEEADAGGGGRRGLGRGRGGGRRKEGRRRRRRRRREQRGVGGLCCRRL